VTGRALQVGVVQLLSDFDPQANLDQVEAYAAEAGAAGVELLVCPEATMSRFGRSLGPVAEPPGGPWASRLQTIADRSGLVIVAGMFTPAADGRVYNTLRAVGRGVDARYDKIHLFDAFGFRESETVAPGQEPGLIRIKDIPVGLTTCYDVRFPGLYTELAARGAEIICVAASWGAGPGKVEQWQLLTRARALDSTTFVVAAGQASLQSAGSGASGNAPTGVGHSAVISPRGEVLAELGPEPGLLIVELDLTGVAETRRAIPVLANARF